MEVIILWIAIALVGQIVSFVLVRRANYNRKRVPAQYRMMAWSIEVDAALAALTIFFFLLGGISSLLIAFPTVLIGYDEFIRAWVLRPLIIGGLITKVVRLLVQYGFIKAIEEEANNG